MKWSAIAVAIGVGLVTLFTVFFPILDPVGKVLRDWAIILTGFAFVVGLINLLSVHAKRIVRRNESGAGYSFIVVVTAILVAGVGFVSVDGMDWIFNNLYSPLQSAFFALVAFFLATAAYRSMRARSFETTLMLIAAVIVFLGQIPLLDALNGGTVLSDMRDWLLQVPNVAGMRGILLGVALGTIATALRLLVGIDRPYSE